VRRASPKYLAFTVVEGTYLVTPTLHARLGVEVQHAMVFRFLRLVGNRKKINAVEAVDGIALGNPRGSISLHRDVAEGTRVRKQRPRKNKEREETYQVTPQNSNSRIFPSGSRSSGAHIPLHFSVAGGTFSVKAALSE
jgi:hypothetical protein